MKKIPFKGCYLNGRFAVPSGKSGKARISQSPGDFSDTIMEWREEGAGPVDRACRAGKKASLSYGKTPLKERKARILNLKRVFQKKFRELAEVIARETGKPLWEARGEARSLAKKTDVTLQDSLKLIEEQKIPEAEGDTPGRVRYRPRGLLAVIGPFNFPMHLPNGQILAGLLSGNAVIFKPSEKTPACGQYLTECFDLAGFPKGVFQMIQGGREASAKLCAHPLTDGVLFTGSFSTGEKIQSATAKDFGKILALEMGGKNSALIWDCKDLSRAVSETLKGCFLTSGQRCSSTDRIILNKKISKDFKRLFVKEAKKLSVGLWKDNPFMGPLIDGEAVKRFFRFQKSLEKEGGTVLLKGREPDGLSGHYVTPGIYQLKFNPKSVFQTEETFTPQVCIYETDSLKEALKIINHSGYGLVLSLFSEDKKIQEEVFHGAKTGLLNINRSSTGASARLPFGGMGRSGNDRPGGVSMISSCVTPVSILTEGC